MTRYEQSFRVVRKITKAKIFPSYNNYLEKKYGILLDNTPTKTVIPDLAKQQPRTVKDFIYLISQCEALKLMQSNCNLDELEAEVDGFLLAHNSILTAIEGRNFHQNLLENIKKWVLAEEKPWGICLKAYGMLESLLKEKLKTEDFGRPLFYSYFGKNDSTDNHHNYIKYLAIALVNKKNTTSHKAHEIEISESEAVDYLCILNIVYTHILNADTLQAVISQEEL